MLSRIEHSSTTLLAVGEPVGEPRNNSENFIFIFHVRALNHYTNLCPRVEIHIRGIDNFMKRLNVSNSTSCTVNCYISHYNDSMHYT